MPGIVPKMDFFATIQLLANSFRSYFRLLIHANFELHHPLINIWQISN